MRTRAVVTLFVALAALTAAASAGPRRGNLARMPADCVFVGERVYTVNPRQPWAEAVAVRGNRIVFVGASRDARAFVGLRTKRIELHGRMLMPGFIDGHNHILSGAAGKRGINLVGSKDKREALARVRAYVGAHPALERYIGFGWKFKMFDGDEATRRDLDAICADRPLLIFNEDNHHAWFNTRAMEVAGITKDTPDPVAGSSYTRDPDRTPRGIAVEPAAWQPIALAGHFFGGREMLVEVAAEIFPLLTRSGITAVYDMGIWAPDLPEGWKGFEFLRDLEKAGKVPCRAQAAGFDVACHVDGDAEVRRILDAIARVQRKRGNGGRRHTLQHSGLIHPADIPRLLALGVGVNATPVWMVDYKGQYGLAERILGAARVASEFHIHRALMEKGVNVSFGSDLPGTDTWEIAPLFQIQAAVTGRVPQTSPSVVPPPSRRPTLAQMLRGYTMGGAWQMHKERLIGSIEVGKRADLIVLSRDLFAIPPGQIATVKVVTTMLDGRVIHSR